MNSSKKSSPLNVLSTVITETNKTLATITPRINVFTAGHMDILRTVIIPARRATRGPRNTRIKLQQIICWEDALKQ